MEPDTETLLAMVFSLLDTPVDTSAVLDALAQCDGDVHRAVALLNLSASTSGHSATPYKKRKKTSNLDGWLQRSSPKKPPSKKDRTTTDNPVSPQIPSVSGSSGECTVSPSPSVLKTVSQPVVNLASILRPPPSSVKTAPRLPPLTLSNPSLVAKYTPCTMHPSILPQDLACQLFYTMLDLSDGWRKNKWWLFDRVVESPHRTGFFARKDDGIEGDEGWQEAAQYWYNGRETGTPPIFPAAMEEACTIIEKAVNEEIHKRDRFPLEWGGSGPEGQIWRANVAASNCYEGAKEGVGPHSDQLTYLGPYPTIASLSLGTCRTFRLREVVPQDEIQRRHAQTFNIPLPHNSLIIMHASTQERFKHSIPMQSALDLYKPAFPRNSDTPIEPSNCRINITFRFYRPDFKAAKTPRCKCGVPCILRPDMKNRQDGLTDKYWWTCYAGAQNDGKGCNFWKAMDIKAEQRGPVVGDENPL